MCFLVLFPRVGHSLGSLKVVPSKTFAACSSATLLLPRAGLIVEGSEIALRVQVGIVVSFFVHAVANCEDEVGLARVRPH